MTIHMTEDEHRTIKRKAAEDEISLQKYVLTSSLSKNGDLHRLPLNSVKDVVSQLRKIGSNLNQIAHTSNSGRRVDRDDLIANLDALEEICRSLRV